MGTHQSDSKIGIRPAVPEEATALTNLTYRSKAAWGYDAAFMKAAAPELVVTPDKVRSSPTFVAETGGAMVGFYALSPPDEPPELDLLFVEPERLRSGIGEMLWRHAVGTAAELGWRSFRIVADPNAEGFYRRMGAQLQGSIPSNVNPQRRMPVLRADVTA